MGELNYKYFMFFLMTNGAFFWYGAYLIFYVLVSEVGTALLCGLLSYGSSVVVIVRTDLRKGPAQRHFHQPTHPPGERARPTVPS